MNKSKEKPIFHNCVEIRSKSKKGNNGNIDKVIDENNQLTTIEKLALRRGIERVNRRRDSQQAKIIKMMNLLDVKQNFQDSNNQSKLQTLFNTILKLKRVYPSKSVMWKAPNNHTLPPYMKAEIRGFVESLNFYNFSVSQFFVYITSPLLVIIFLSSKAIERL